MTSYRAIALWDHSNLLPLSIWISNTGLTISEKQEMLSIKNRMVQISYNFPQNKIIDKCQCGEEETMEHIYCCKLLNKEEHQLSFKLIITGNIGEQITIFKIFQNNMKERERLLNNEKLKNQNFHVIPNGDPLYDYL